MKRTTRRVFTFLAIAALAFTVYNFVGERGFYRLGKMMQRRNNLNATVDTLQRQNTELAEEIVRLRSDPVTLEELARTKLGMVRPGEVVYIFPEKAGGDQK